MSEVCPNCGAKAIQHCPRHFDEDGSEVGGYVEFACGVEYWNETRFKPFYTKQTLRCMERQLANVTAERDEALRAVAIRDNRIKNLNNSWDEARKVALEREAERDQLQQRVAELEGKLAYYKTKESDEWDNMPVDPSYP